MYCVVITACAIVFFLALVMVLRKSGILQNILVKFGVVNSKEKTNWTAFSWESCLMKMNCKADVVLFGDSIIRGSNFHLLRPALRFVNLGCSGDTLSGMFGRVSTVQLLEPQKIFIMAGINGLTDYNVKNCLQKYGMLLKKLRNDVPNAKIYVHSLLPLSAVREKKNWCKNSTIQRFNRELKRIVSEEKLTYIDIYDAYTSNGKMNPNLTVDGIHLKPEAYSFWEAEIAKYI